MPVFSKRSLDNLATCHPDIQKILQDAIRTASPDLDFVVICGHRGKADQDAACAKGASKTPWPKSRHNSLPSEAADVIPYPVDWNDAARFRKLAAHVKATADRLGIQIEWGGDWRGFVDMPHYQLPRR